MEPFRITDAELVWVPRDSPNFTRTTEVNGRQVVEKPLRARQVACLFCTVNGHGYAAILEAKTLRPPDSYRNLQEPVGEGYLFSKLEMNSRQVYHHSRLGTDWGIVASGLSEAELNGLVRAMDHSR